MVHKKILCSVNQAGALAASLYNELVRIDGHAFVPRTPAVAAKILDTIGKLAKTGTPSAGKASPAELNVVARLSGVIPWPPPGHPLQAIVTTAELKNARSVIRKLNDQVKAKAKLK